VVEDYVPVEGGRLWYERAGEGFPVVLIHPGLWDSRIWDGQFDDFALQHDVIRYDLRGYGRSDLPYGPYSDLRDLVRLLEELEVARCALVGCATGAQLAIDFALALPEVAEAVVAVSPTVSGYAWEDSGLGVLMDEVARAVRDGDLARAIELELAVWAPVSTEDPTTNGHVRTIAMDNAHVLEIGDTLLEVGPPALPKLGGMEAATLIVVGDRDLAETHAIADLLAGAIPGAMKRVIADADQLVNVGKAERFNRLVLDFLSFRM
jgi:pimeloyl-ACP methyl ester carboxylesterase